MTATKRVRSVTAATDFSRDATQAVRRAALLSGALPARLELLHVVDASPWAQASALFGRKQGGKAAYLEAARRKLDATMEALENIETPSMRARADMGNVLDEILRASAASDLLVLGARGQRRMRETLLGTTAERLLQKGRGAMLVVKEAARHAYRHVVVPIDFSADSILALEAALRLAPDATITLVHAYDVVFEGMLWRGDVPKSTVENFRREARSDALSRLNGVATSVGLQERRFEKVVTRGYPPRVILAAAQRKKADLIAIGKQGRSMLGRLLVGSVTRHVLGECRCDVLVVRRRSS
jgi:nucleotide-binding universal stress UspA family protein